MKQLLINKCEGVSLKYYNDPKTFTEYSNDVDVIYENIEELNLNKEHQITSTNSNIIII